MKTFSEMFAKAQDIAKNEGGRVVFVGQTGHIVRNMFKIAAEDNKEALVINHQEWRIIYSETGQVGFYSVDNPYRLGGLLISHAFAMDETSGSAVAHRVRSTKEFKSPTGVYYPWGFKKVEYVDY